MVKLRTGSPIFNNDIHLPTVIQLKSKILPHVNKITAPNFEPSDFIGYFNTGVYYFLSQENQTTFHLGEW